MYKQDESKLIAGLAIGALIGAGVTYMVFSAKRGHWLQHMQAWAGKMKQDIGAMEEKYRAEACHCNEKPLDESSPKE